MLNFGNVLFVIVYFLVVQIMFYDIKEGKLSRREVNVKYNNFKFVVYRIYKCFFLIFLIG